jgi:NAD-dependent SIR2 family protein deacetylase
MLTSGAGVSTAAAIPDFRGAAGLFSSNSCGKKGKEPMKDLFHIKALAVGVDLASCSSDADGSLPPFLLLIMP